MASCYQSHSHIASEFSSLTNSMNFDRVTCEHGEVRILICGCACRTLCAIADGPRVDALLARSLVNSMRAIGYLALFPLALDLQSTLACMFRSCMASVQSRERKREMAFFVLLLRAYGVRASRIDMMADPHRRTVCPDEFHQVLC